MKRTIQWITHTVSGKLMNGNDEQQGVHSVSTDSRSIQSGALYVPLTGERFNGHDFIFDAIQRGAVASLWSNKQPIPEGVGIPLILVDNPLHALHQMAHQYRQELDIPIVAITGSNGKTTTKDLIASVLLQKYKVYKTAGNLNNHIGVPLTLLSIPEETEIAIVEMGMNHRGEISLLSKMAVPSVSVITNIGESHIEYLGSRAGIAEAKLEILDGLSSDGVLIYDGDEPLLRERTERIPQKKILVGWEDQNHEAPTDVENLSVEGFRFRSRKTGSSFYLPLLGKHNLVNALYAVEVGRHFGMTDLEIAEGLSHVQITGMRLEMVTAKCGLSIINDSYNASPTSVRAALDLLQEIDPSAEKWALLGDIREIGGAWEESYHRDLGAYAIEKGVTKLFTVGDRGRWISEGAKAANGAQACEVIHFSNTDEVSKYIEKIGHPQVYILVKASRAMKLDQVVRSLVEGAVKK